MDEGDQNRTNFSSCGLSGSFQETFETSDIGYIAIELLLAVLIAFGNILVLIAVSKFSELKNSLNVFVVSLAISDLVVGLVALPVHIVIFLFPHIKQYWFVCLFRYLLLPVSCGTSAVTLIVISIDRYLAIENPFLYSRVMTIERAKLITLAVWIVTTTCALLPIFGWNNWTPCTPCVFTAVIPKAYIMGISVGIFIFAVILGVLNLKIFLTANSAAKDIQNQRSKAPNNGRDTHRSSNAFFQNKRAMKTLCLMYGAFIMGTIPCGVAFLWEIHSPNIGAPFFDPIRIGTTFLSFLNSCLNPLIYHRRIPEFNAAFRKILRLKPRINPCPE